VASTKYLDGINILKISKNVDERGYFSEIFRNDWKKEILGKDEIAQANLSVSFPGVIRAWHRHNQGQVDYFLVLQGTVKICAYDEETKQLNEIISSGESLQLVRIPGYYWHGFKNVGNKTSVVIYFVNRLYDYNNPDEERRPWDDSKIVDKKTGQPFDWNRPAHK
jgi:dTDP-4-dehydrorhamnose 3,5-epimerase